MTIDGAPEATASSTVDSSLLTPERTIFSPGTPSARQMRCSPGEHASRRSTSGSSAASTKVFAFTA